MNAYAILHNRVEEVINETVQLLNKEVQAGRITSDAAIDKVQHLVHTIRKFMDSADAQAPASFTDFEAAPSSAHVDVVNVVNLPAQQIRLDMDAVEFRPQLAFVKLKCGQVNLYQVAHLDEDGDFLYLAGGAKIKLTPADTKRLNYYLQLFYLR